MSAQPMLELPVGGRVKPTLPRLWVQLSRVRRNTIGIIGAVIILATVLVALVGPLAWRTDYASQASRRLLPPTAAQPFGTDELGRDELSRIIHGAQVSLQVGMISVVIALVTGTIIGIVAGFYGRTVDAALMRVVDIMFAFPGIVLAIVIAGLLGPSRTNAMIAIGIVYTPAFARVVRGSTLSVLSLPYVEAARSLGIRDTRIILRHLLPNITAPLIVLTTVYLSTAILTEAALSFLGLGTQPPEPSWGSMLNASRSYMERAPWLAIAPGLAIMVVVLGFNFLGDGLRDVLDPQLRDA
jgi:peptide/nickel transport system permease protein